MEAYAQKNGYTWGKDRRRKSEDTDYTDTVESYPDIASIEDIARTARVMLTPDSDISSPGTPGMSASPVRTCSHGKN